MSRRTGVGHELTGLSCQVYTTGPSLLDPSLSGDPTRPLLFSPVLTRSSSGSVQGGSLSIPGSTRPTPDLSFDVLRDSFPLYPHVPGATDSPTLDFQFRLPVQGPGRVTTGVRIPEPDSPGSVPGPQVLRQGRSKQCNRGPPRPQRVIGPNESLKSSVYPVHPSRSLRRPPQTRGKRVVT